MAMTILASKGDGRSPGASAGSDALRGATLIADVKAAIEAIGGRPSPEAISEKICPFGVDDEE